MRPVLKTALKISLFLPLGLLGLSIALYLVLLLINRHDQPPSAAYTDLVRVSEERPVSPDNENGYIYAAGLHASRDEDPEQSGKSFIEKQKALAKKKEFNANYEKSKFGTAFKQLPEKLSVTLNACFVPGDECLQRMFSGRDTFKPALTKNAWMLERYSRLINHPQWRETSAFTLWNDFPHYEDIMNSQKLFLVSAWISAYEGNGKAANYAIARDHNFWRMVLSSTNSLLARMVATTALNRNYLFGALFLQTQPTAKGFEIPADWRKPYSAEEISMRRVMSGEIIFSREMVREIWGMKRLPWEEKNPRIDDIIAELKNRLGRPLALPQDSLNIQTDYYEKMMKTFNVPLGQYEKALKEAQISQASQKSLLSRIHAYNPVGRWLIAQNEVGMYENYFLRSADLEGTRRLAVLMSELHAKKVSREDLGAVVAASEMKNPYTDQPFIVEPGNDYVVFNGLEEDKQKARHAFFYR